MPGRIICGRIGKAGSTFSSAGDRRRDAGEGTCVRQQESDEGGGLTRVISDQMRTINSVVSVSKGNLDASSR